MAVRYYVEKLSQCVHFVCNKLRDKTYLALSCDSSSYIPQLNALEKRLARDFPLIRSPVFVPIQSNRLNLSPVYFNLCILANWKTKGCGLGDSRHFFLINDD